jgi:dynein heavy chain, axonemal
MTLTPADIAVVRRLGRPPRLIRLIMDCVLILFASTLKNPIKIDPELQGAEPSWESSLKVIEKRKKSKPLASIDIVACYF